MVGLHRLLIYKLCRVFRVGYLPPGPTSGELISILVPPSELESVLLTHPEIADVAVIGVDDPAEATELPRFAFLTIAETLPSIYI